MNMGNRHDKQTLVQDAKHIKMFPTNLDMLRSYRMSFPSLTGTHQLKQWNSTDIVTQKGETMHLKIL